MAITISQDKSRELFELLKERLEIPAGVIWINLRIGVDEAPTIECKYYPQFKDKKE